MHRNDRTAGRNPERLKRPAIQVSRFRTAQVVEASARPTTSCSTMALGTSAGSMPASFRAARSLSMAAAVHRAIDVGHTAPERSRQRAPRAARWTA